MFKSGDAMEALHKSRQQKGTTVTKQRTYNDIVQYLDHHWSVERPESLERVRHLDQALDTPSRKLNALIVAGTNGKSLTAHFTTKLLQEEGLTVGSFYSPHLLTYNERCAVNRTTVQNKHFTDIANTVIETAEAHGITAHTQELLTMIALMYFVNNKVDVAVLESDCGGAYNPVNICDAKVATITRVTSPRIDTSEQDVRHLMDDMLGIVTSGTYLVSGDQNKSHLQYMQESTHERGGNWIMPIRKLAHLTYPYEQLHGRCAALAERMAHTYMNTFVVQDATVVSNSLLVKQKGQRGRPTLEAKRQAQLNPQKTLEQFWKETVNELPGRFHLLDKEKPSILLDTANNIDAFKNLLLGIRLLNYQRTLKGLAVIIGASHDTLHHEEFLKLLRYFFKKTSGELYICPIDTPLPGSQEETSWNVEHVTNDLKSMKIKAKAFTSFNEAFTAAKEVVDERDGLIVVSGSHSIVHQYWNHKGVRKL